MKKIIIAAIGLIIIAGTFLYLSDKEPEQTQEQAVLEHTLKISKEYTVLRYRTENVLEKAEEYEDYDKWSGELAAIIDGWGELENDATELEKNADKLANEKTALGLIREARAYDSVEIQKVIETAPAGRQVRTLAKHLGVDAKMAQLILNETQDRISREAYGEEGDVFETCEQNSMRIKNGAKVTVFVGGVVLTGGASAVAASGVVAKTALVVSGADLVLEVADDEAKIALGDKNKVSEMVGKVRTVTEPAASILTIANIPGNVSKAMEKIGAISFAGDQIRSVVQDEKILGISIKTDEKGEVKAQVSGITEAELAEWKKENDAIVSIQPIEEIVMQFKEENKEEKVAETPKEEDKKEAPKTDSEGIPNQIYKIVNVSGSSYMMDVCHTPTCWDDLAANPAEDRDVGGIYTLGKVFGQGESFRHGFRPADLKASGRLENGYRITVYFAIAPFEGPKHKTIEYGTWQNHSIEIEAKYGDEPVIEWDGNSLRQAK